MSEEMAALEAEIQQEATEQGVLADTALEAAPDSPDTAPEAKADESTQEVKMVPHAALHEERERRKAAERTLSEQRERLEARLNALAQKFEEVTTPTPVKPPDFEEDPTGYIKAQLDKVTQTLEQEQRKTKEQQEVSQRNQQYQEFVGAYQNDAARFSQQQTDFKDAYQHLLSDRDAELQELGFYDEAIRAKIIQNEEIGIVEQALREGVSPAQRLYNLAKRRGYKVAAPVGEQAKEEIQRLQSGQKAARSLSEVPGKGNVSGPSLETIANMDDDEFAEAVKGNNWLKLLKGK